MARCFSMLCLSLASFFTLTFQSAPSAMSSKGKPDTDVFVDEQLYSRQIFVYGRSAQQSLLNAHVVINGYGDLTLEIIKNLALAGVGKISLPKDIDQCTTRLKGSLASTEAYIRAINPQVLVSTYNDFMSTFSQEGTTVALCSGKKLSEIATYNDICRSGGRGGNESGIMMVACDVRGVCGFVFDDFGNNFIVRDVTGEAAKEVPLLQAITELSSSVDNNTGNNSAPPRLRVTCIDEETYGELGVGDSVELTWTPLSKNIHHIAAGSLMGLVESVLSPRVINVRVLGVYDAPSVLDFITAADAGNAALKKSKQSKTVQHRPFSSFLKSPTFTPCNGCLSERKSTALSLVLLAAFAVAGSVEMNAIRGINRDFVSTHEEYAEDDGSPERLFRTCILSQLKTMGVNAPLKPIKMGGVGLETLDDVTSRFLHCLCASSYDTDNIDDAADVMHACPATVSVVGAIAAQEVIKAITQVYEPAAQMMMFESLDVLETRKDDSTKSIGNADGWLGSLLRLLGFGSSRSNQDDDRHACSGTSICTNGSVSNVSLYLQNLYGSEVMRELQRMRVFIVGAGAIGCEVVKTLALIGVGAGKESTTAGNTSTLTADKSTPTVDKLIPASGLWGNVTGGSMLVTDMDHIERSNLNRQLLFRQRHLGQAKALVAAEMVREINPDINIHGLTLKLGKDTETVFDASFWATTDVVIPALDNIDARMYVDAQCVKHAKFLIDSGTLGTKGSTQVVVPHLTESYASSADPPEAAIPLCTLKSFPYHPDHCVSWSRSTFDQLFESDVRTLKSLFSASLSLKANESDEIIRAKISAIVSSLSPDEIYRHIDTLSDFLPGEEVESTPDRLAGSGLIIRLCISWAARLFRRMFSEEVQVLIYEHPKDEITEEGVPFWGGSRRFPRPLTFDPSDSIHKEFVLWAAALRTQCYIGVSALMTATDPVLKQAYEERRIARGASLYDSSRVSLFDAQPVAAEPTEDALVAAVLNVPESLRSYLGTRMAPQEFDKDDPARGHIDFSLAATNLRCEVYSIRSVDRLQVQRVAGKIVPAVVTTTALVSGLVCHELIKIASENVRSRVLRKISSHATIDISAQKNRKSASVLKRLIRFFSGPCRKQRREADIIPASSKDAGKKAVADTERDRRLKRFRNSFVNLARPLLAFAEPVPAEARPLRSAHPETGSGPKEVGTTAGTARGDEETGDGRGPSQESFTMWDRLMAPESAATLSIRGLVHFLSTRFGDDITLQSASCGDLLLYADFMSGSSSSHDQDEGEEVNEDIRHSKKKGFEEEEDYSISFLLERAHRRASEHDACDDRVTTIAKESEVALLSAGFIDLEVACLAENGKELHIPAVRVALAQAHPIQIEKDGVGGGFFQLIVKSAAGFIRTVFNT